MCKEPRVNASSIRYSASVARIVNAAKGDTFADKFENICLDYIENIAKREQHIKDLDKQILDKEKKLSKVRIELEKYTTIAEKADILQKAIIMLTDKCNTK